MSKLLLPLAFLVAGSIVMAPTSAQAGWVIEGSVGKGAQVSPSPVKAESTNVMVAPGYHLFSLLRLQLGLVGDLGDIEGRSFDLQVRPMIGIYPPLFPLYGRLIFAMQGLLDDPHIAVGGAAGLKLGIPMTGLGVFAEVGVLPRFVDSTTQVLLEGRLGAYWAF